MDGKSFGKAIVTAAALTISASFAHAQVNVGPPVVSKDAPVSPVRKGDPQPADPSQKGAIDPSDRQIMENMARGGIAEVETSQVAQTNASSQSVKQFAQQMVKDHGDANRELQQLANQKGVKLPSEPDAAHQKALDDAKQSRGPEFDKAYLSKMMQDYQDAKRLFENASKNASDPDLKAFAQKTLPVIEHHAQMADNLSRSMQPTGG